MSFDVLMQTWKEQINILKDLKCSKNSFTEQHFIIYLQTLTLYHIQFWTCIPTYRETTVTCALNHTNTYQ